MKHRFVRFSRATASDILVNVETVTSIQKVALPDPIKQWSFLKLVDDSDGITVLGSLEEFCEQIESYDFKTGSVSLKRK